MSWDSTLNQYGLAINSRIPTAQFTPLQNSALNTPNGTSGPPSGGQLLSALVISSQGGGNNAVYLDYQGIYAGNPVFANAPFSINLAGLATFKSANTNLEISASNDNIIFYTAGVPTIVIQG
jgi:hypothetical protein